MSLAKYNGAVLDGAGEGVAASIEVRQDSVGQPLVQIYSDRDGASALGNPFTANSDGSFGFHVAGGAYRIRAYTGPSGAPTFEKILRYVPVGLNAESDTVNLSDVVGNLPVARLNSGTGATATTFWRGDGVWAAQQGAYDTVADALGADSSQDVFQTRGKLAVDDGGGATYLQVASDPTEEGAFQLTNLNWAKLHQPVVTPQMFKASGDAGNAALMLQRFVTYVCTDGTIGVIPRGTYAMSTGVTITAPSDRRVSIFADGALFTTSAAIFAFTVTGGAYSGGVDLYNFSFDQQNNSNALGAIRLIQCGSARIIKPVIECGQTTNIGYSGIYIAQATASDTATGSFWNVIQDPQIFSSTADQVPWAILLQGAANATRIVGGNLSTVTRGIGLYNEPSSGNYCPNGVVIDGVSFEVGTYGIYYNGVAGDIDSRVLGLRIVNGRFENVTTGIRFHNCDQVSESPPVIASNMFLGGTTRVENPGNINITGDELWVPYTPTISASSGTITTTAVNGARYKQQGKVVTFSVKITVTTNGSGAGFLKFTLPIASGASNPGASFAGASTAAVALSCIIAAGVTSDVFVATVAGAYPAASGFSMYCSGSYEI